MPSPVPQVCLWRLDLPGRFDVDAKADAEREAERQGQDKAIASLAEPWLRPDERARCAALRQPADRLRFAVTRAVLRALLAERLGRAAASLPFAVGPHGKPYLALPDAPRFNVSHAGAHGCIAIADSGEVGVDIERIDPALRQPELSAMAAHCLTPRERAWLATRAPARWPPAFHALWTGKEALLKAMGLGIGDHLAHVSVAIGIGGEEGTGGEGAEHGDDQPRQCAVLRESGQLAGHAAELARVRLHLLPAPAAYAAAMAWVPPA